MLNKKSPFDYRQSAGMYFSSLASIEGRLNEHEDIVIDGRFTGTITTQGFCEISENGVFEGELTARSITILGQTDGELNGTDSIVVKKSAKIKGFYRTPKISIESGAEVDARVKQYHKTSTDTPLS